MLERIDKYVLCEYVYNRCKTSKKADFVAVITSLESSDDELVDFCINKNIPIFRGDLNNVLDRYIKAANYFGAENIVRVCGDSPFVDIDLIDEIIQLAADEQFKYCAATNCINGFMSELIRLGTLEEILQKEDLSAADSEHVTKYIRDRQDAFECGFVDANLRPSELEDYTLTVDYPLDIEIARTIAMNLKDFNFKSTDIIEILQKLEG